MARVVVSSAAEADYAEAFRWYAERSIRTAQRFETEFAGALEAIASDPQRFPRCDTRHRYYLMGRFPFQVVFRFHDEDVVVIAVAHTKRKPMYWAGR
ncbi:MAG: type II toxin-antitoxin system RelE/ParE family toxin [Thermoguttaceae bacterium]|jgi:plasmid stabilization system protein ParE